MTVQSEQNSAGSSSQTTVTCVFTSPNIAGDSITVCVGPCSFASITTATVTDTSGNSYTQQELQTSSDNYIILITAFNIKAAAASANTVQCVLNQAAFNNNLPIIIVEGPPASGVRAVNSAQGLFGSATATVTLTGTVAGDYVVGFCCQMANSGSTVPTVGSAGTNTMTALQTYNINDGGQSELLVEAANSSGGTINVTAHTDNTQTGWIGWLMAAVAYIPAANTPPANALLFGSD